MATQGKNKRRQFEILDDIHDVNLSVDSIEECDTINWLCEANRLSIINDFEYQPKSFLLFDQSEYVDIYGKKKTLFREHQYTPDFCIHLTPEKNLLLSKEFKIEANQLSCQDFKVYIDSKGTFNKNERAFNYNQKWMWQKFKIYIYKLVPKKFFEKFGVPEKSILTEKTKKPRKNFIGFKMLKDIFDVK